MVDEARGFRLGLSGGILGPVAGTYLINLVHTLWEWSIISKDKSLIHETQR